MREAIRDIDRLQHIDECIDHINDYLRGKSFENMKADIMCFHAVVYNIMIIGEAANLLTKDFREKHSEVPWRDIVDMRNALVHGYILHFLVLLLLALTGAVITIYRDYQARPGFLEDVWI